MSKKKGDVYEEYVSVWARLEHGAQKTTRNPLMRGRSAKRPYDCDVHVELYSALWDVLQNLALGVVALGALAVAVAWLVPDDPVAREVASAQASFEEGVSQVVPSFAGYGAVGAGILLLALAFYGRSRTETHVWVECKNRKTTVKRSDIQQLAAKVEDVAGGRNAWHPDEVWFVSSSPFDQDAQDVARSVKIRCFYVPME